MEVVLVAFAAILVLGLGGYLLMSAAPTAPTAQIGQFAEAIARQEGSNSTWNNPGDLVKSFGFATTGVANADGVLIFATLEDGWKALYQQLLDIAQGNSHFSTSTTLNDFGLAWSNGDANWAPNVAGFLGVDPSVTLGQILGVN